MKSIKVLLAVICLSVLLSASNVSKADDNKSYPESKIIDAEKLIKDVKYLSSDELKGREADTPENAIAREYVVKRFKESGIKPFNNDYLQKFTFKNRQGKSYNATNVLGYIKGKKNPDKYIVITAHFDHVGVRNNEIYNGADDNASGTAALFAIAKYFKKKKPKHSLLFIALDAEEKGLQGARYFVDNPTVPLKDIVLNVNMDMISRNDKNELYAAGTFHYPQLKKYLIPVQKKAKIKLLFGHDDPKLGRDDWTFSSDHGPFHRKKIAFIYFGVEDHKDYHKPTDDFENIQPKFYVNAVETIVIAIKEIDKNYKVG